MTDRQEMLNALSQVEDAARAARNSQPDDNPQSLTNRKAFHLIAQLAQVIREQVA